MSRRNLPSYRAKSSVRRDPLTTPFAHLHCPRQPRFLNWQPRRLKTTLSPCAGNKFSISNRQITALFFCEILRISLDHCPGHCAPREGSRHVCIRSVARIVRRVASFFFFGFTRHSTLVTRHCSSNRHTRGLEMPVTPFVSAKPSALIATDLGGNFQPSIRFLRSPQQGFLAARRPARQSLWRACLRVCRQAGRRFALHRPSVSPAAEGHESRVTSYEYSFSPCAYIADARQRVLI